MITEDRWKEIVAGPNGPPFQELVDEIEMLRGVLSKTQGSLHVINAHASTIRRWLKDPNLHPEEECKAIEDERLKAHQRISDALFPFDREMKVAKKFMEKS